MAGYLVGTMSSSLGWESKSPTEALAKHITYWFESRRNQGKVLGEVPSFYYLIQKYGQDPDKLVEQTGIELKTYIKELFLDCEVTVTRENLTGQTNQYTLTIASRIVSDGVSYDLADAVLITGQQYKLLDKARLG